MVISMSAVVVSEVVYRRRLPLCTLTFKISVDTVDGPLPSTSMGGLSWKGTKICNVTCDVHILMPARQSVGDILSLQAIGRPDPPWKKP